jgi:uncharacterized phage protein gp47/JayE
MSDFTKTPEEILTELLANISDTYQKTIGYPAYDFSKTFAMSESGLYSAIDIVDKMRDVANLTGDDLTKFVLQRKGIIRKLATFSTGVLAVTGSATINTGDLFESAGGIQFKATETKTITTSGTINIQCLTAGEAGNIGANSITLMPVTIAGITSVTNEAGTSGGYEAESDNDLRQRYLDALLLPITSGNKNHYITWAKEVAGVGGAKVFPLEYGNNSVEVIIIDANKQPADAGLIADVQEYIDPASSGSGEGQAPIGAYCYVNSATGVNINISCTITLLSGYLIADVQTNIENSIVAYLKSIAFNQDFVSYAQIGSYILNSEGVQDYADLLVNEGTSNIALGAKEVAIIGTVEASESSV